MFLSIQQKFILDTLKKLNCVRRRQLHALMQGRFQQDGFEITQARMEAMLRQLRAGTADVRLDGGLVWLSNAQPDSRRLEAIDVMIELTGGKPQEFNASREPPQDMGAPDGSLPPEFGEPDDAMSGDVPDLTGDGEGDAPGGDGGGRGHAPRFRRTAARRKPSRPRNPGQVRTRPPRTP